MGQCLCFCCSTGGETFPDGFSTFPNVLVVEKSQFCCSFNFLKFKNLDKLVVIYIFQFMLHYVICLYDIVVVIIMYILIIIIATI